jgi:hypothetical protein
MKTSVKASRFLIPNSSPSAPQAPWAAQNRKGISSKNGHPLDRKIAEQLCSALANNRPVSVQTQPWARRFSQGGMG